MGARSARLLTIGLMLATVGLASACAGQPVVTVAPAGSSVAVSAPAVPAEPGTPAEPAVPAEHAGHAAPAEPAAPTRAEPAPAAAPDANRRR